MLENVPEDAEVSCDVLVDGVVIKMGVLVVNVIRLVGAQEVLTG